MNLSINWNGQVEHSDSQKDSSPKAEFEAVR